MSEEHPQHPLVVDRTMPIRDWDHWKELWKQHPIAEIRDALLHRGFQIPIKESERHGRIQMYLSIADNPSRSIWSSVGDNLSLPEESKSRLGAFGKRDISIAGTRVFVARTAFRILCTEVFTNPDYEFTSHKRPRFPAVWVTDLLGDEETFTKLLRFLRLEWNYSQPNLHCLGFEVPKEFKEVLTQFIKDLWEHSFRFYCVSQDTKYPNETDKDKEISSRLKIHRPFFLELMYAIGEVRVVLGHVEESQYGSARFGNRLDTETEAKLRELALRKNISHGGGIENHSSIVNASYSGNKAASILLLYDLHKQESARLQHIADAKKRLDAAEAELAKAAAN